MAHANPNDGDRNTSCSHLVTKRTLKLVAVTTGCGSRRSTRKAHKAHTQQRDTHTQSRHTLNQGATRKVEERDTGQQANRRAAARIGRTRTFVHRQGADGAVHLGVATEEAVPGQSATCISWHANERTIDVDETCYRTRTAMVLRHEWPRANGCSVNCTHGTMGREDKGQQAAAASAAPSRQ